MRDFGGLEAQIMQRMWDRAEPASVRDILEELQQERSIAYTTVMTVMDNLHRKGHLTRTQEGRAYLYTSVRTREEHHALLMSEALEASADRSGTLLSFLGRMTTEEIQDLRRLLTRAGSRRSRRPEQG
ncbi:MAG: BlaI/MecI/CopY family transcriptional regulator [Actinomycetes bacterium]